MKCCIALAVILCLVAGEPIRREQRDTNSDTPNKVDGNGPTKSWGSTKRKVIIDTDMGIDDACALIMALSNPDKFDILALTITAGNIPLPQVIANANRIKRLAKRENIPVYKGSDRPLVTSIVEKVELAVQIHGKDGLGDTPDTFPPFQPSDFNGTVPGKHAAEAMIELARANPGCTIINLGPLTNLALALKLDPTFVQYVDHVFVMGGNIRAVGNVLNWVTAEFNFNTDPEAANIVLTEMGRPITAVPWEMLLDFPTTKDFENSFTNHMTTNKGRFVHEMTRVYKTVNPVYGLADEMAMSVALDSSVILDSINHWAVVELAGRNTRGQVAIDWMNDTKKASNVQLVSKVNITRAMEMLVKSLDD